MKYQKILGIAAVAAMAVMAFTAGSASATTLEIEKIAQNKSVALAGSLEAGTSALLQLTGGGFANTCTESNFSGATTVFTGASVSGPLSSLSFKKCTNEAVVVDKAGSLRITHMAGTTDGTVFSSGAEITVPSPIGTLNCKTGPEWVLIGVLVGVFVVAVIIGYLVGKAILNCGFLAPSVTWTAKYPITSPLRLGVVS